MKINQHTRQISSANHACKCKRSFMCTQRHGRVASARHSNRQTNATNVTYFIKSTLIYKKIKNKKESLANANVSARQQCVYEGPLAKIYCK